MEYVKESDVKEFIKRLPDISLSPPTVHLIMLAVRSRKAREIMGEKIQDIVVERKIIRPIDDWRNRYLNSVFNLAILQHNGKYDVKNKLVPAQAMGIFGTLSPRNVLSSNADLMKENISYFYQLDEEAKMQLAKEPSRFFGMLHRHKDRNTNFVTLDLDTDDKKIYSEILNECSNFKIWMVTETGRGFHIILDLTKSEDAKRFYGENQFRQRLGLKFKSLEFQKDAQEPIAGTYYDSPRNKHHWVKILI